MVNQEIISLMKRRVDELTNDEIIVIRDYCNQKIERFSEPDRPVRQEIAGAILRHMIKMAGG